MRRDRKQGRRLSQQDEERSPALATGAFRGFERQPPPFAFQLLHCPASGVADDRLWRKPNAIALPPRPFTPVLVLRDAVDEVAHRVEHRAPHEHRCGDGELELLDVALVAEGEYTLEGLG